MILDLRLSSIMAYNGSILGSRNATLPTQQSIFHDFSWGRRLEQDGLQISVCEDIYQLFNWDRFTGGVNLFEEFYTCGCDGDFLASFKLSCALENFCFNNTVDGRVTCVNINLEHHFRVDQTSGFVEPHPEKVIDCIEYLEGGPPGTLCQPSSPWCAYLLRDTHGYSTETSLEICNNYRDECPPFLKALGYSEQETDIWCSATTFEGIECNSSLIGNCEEASNLVFHRINPDCTNIAPCMAPSCQAISRTAQNQPGSRVPIYEACDESSELTFPPSFQPTPQFSTLPSSAPSRRPTPETTDESLLFESSSFLTQVSIPNIVSLTFVLMGFLVAH